MEQNSLPQLSNREKNAYIVKLYNSLMSFMDVVYLVILFYRVLLMRTALSQFRL